MPRNLTDKERRMIRKAKSAREEKFTIGGIVKKSFKPAPISLAPVGGSTSKDKL